MLAQISVFPMVFDNDVSELSVWDSHQNATHTTRSLPKKSSVFLYEYRHRQWDMLESDPCNTRTWSSLQDHGFVTYPRYSVQCCLYLNMHPIFTLSLSLSLSLLFLREIAFNINLNMKKCFHPFDQQMSLPYADDSSPFLTLTSPCPSLLPSIY